MRRLPPILTLPVPLHTHTLSLSLSRTPPPSSVEHSLQSRYGSRLLVLRGEPVATLTSIFKASSSSTSTTTSADGAGAAATTTTDGAPFTCDAIVWEEEAVEPYGRKRDDAVAAAAAAAGVVARAVPGGHHLWNPSEALDVAVGKQQAGGGKAGKAGKAPPMTMKGFETLAAKLGPVPPPLPPPAALPPLPAPLLKLLSSSSPSSSSSSSSADHLLPPSALTDLPGFANDPQAISIEANINGDGDGDGDGDGGGGGRGRGAHCYGLVGGETAGLARLEALIGPTGGKGRDAWVAAFEKPKTRSTGFDGGPAKNSASTYCCSVAAPPLFTYRASPTHDSRRHT
jgi:hypothetical protein